MWPAALGCIFLLGGCAGPLAFREGNDLIVKGKYEEGLTKLSEAVAYEPDNVQYKITYEDQRLALVNRLLKLAEVAKYGGQFDEAEAYYFRVMEIDRRNEIAKLSLQSITLKRRHAKQISDAEDLFHAKGNAAIQDVKEVLRQVLTEDPTDKNALALKASIETSMTEKAPGLQLSTAFRKPISLQFRDAPLRTVFDLISQISGLNFYFDSDIRPDIKVTIGVKNTSIEDVIHLLLVTNQLKQKILNDNSVLIYPNTAQKIKDYQTMVVRSFFLTNADVKAVSNTIKTIVKTQDMVVDERLGIIILRDTPEAIRMAEKIVALQDISDAEVMLEVEVLEVQRSRLMELGIQWPTQLSLSPLQVGTTPVTLKALKNISSSTTQATIGPLNINADKEDQDITTLANPRIRVRNREKAKILIGDRVPVITTTSTATGFVAESVTYIDVGLKLEVEPTVYLDNDVAIKINLEVSSLVKEIVSKAGSLSYQIGTRGADTVLRLKNGETQILAGLISDEDRSSASKIPGLGDLPILGRLFGSKKSDGSRSEILLSITPRVVRSVRRPELSMAEFDSGTDTEIGGRPLSIVPTTPPVSAAGVENDGLLDVKKP
jgi:general secretion pathway protein D